MRIYKDSKELPLFNYERMLETKNFLYMIKGYQDGDNISFDTKELESKFNEIMQDFVVSLNAKSMDIVNYGNIQRYNVEMVKLKALLNVINATAEVNEIKRKRGVSVDNSNILDLLNLFKIPKSDDLQKQAEIITARIDKFQNDINHIASKIKQEDNDQESEVDINEIITNVELILERTIDLEKTSLYRFGIMQEQAVKKIEQMNKINERYGR
jgi:hypothetical protein|nr:MAG TPA: hypothetical protein [Caudoviricetes sp.]